LASVAARAEAGFALALRADRIVGTRSPSRTSEEAVTFIRDSDESYLEILEVEFSD
jgi:hypothetical protein